MSKMNWTKSQKSAISEKGRDLLVSASAGSGKTTVMIERIAQMVRSGDVAVDELLVLTFTKATAADMRTKLRKKLGDEYLDALSVSSIGTFHKFCSDLVRTYFNLLGLDPAFDILDDYQAKSIQNEILDKMLAENISKCQDAIYTFCVNRKTEGFKDLIVDITKFLATREDADEWLNSVALASYGDQFNPSLRKIKEFEKEMKDYYNSKFIGHLMTAKYEGAEKIIPQIEATMKGEFTRLSPCKVFSEYEDFRDTRSELKKELARLEYSAEQSNDRRIVEQTIYLVKEFTKVYAQEKRRREVLDFADMEAFALEVLSNVEVRQSIKEKYKFIFIDEYQDTSPIQEKILSLISKRDSIFMVGDVKQSIYSFRGCEVAIFANKLTDFDKNLGGKVVRLNENFRSDPAILKFVNRVFEKIMPDYSGFEVKDFGTDGAVEVIVLEGKDDEENSIVKQSALIAKKINEQLKNGARMSDIAILGRNSTHFLKLKEVLQKAGISSAVVEKQKANKIPEISMLNNFLFAVANPENELPLFKTMVSVFGHKLSEGKKYKQEHLEILGHFREFSKTHTVAEVLDKFMAEYMVHDDTGKIGKYMNILRGASFATNLTRFLYLLEHDLLDIELDGGGSVRECVQIMTIHKSKGLEFPIVFLFDAGVNFSGIDKRKFLVIDKECGLCVYATDLDEYTRSSSLARLGALISGERQQVEEEKRLLYVALTRAKEKLIIIGTASSDRVPRVAKNYFHFLPLREAQWIEASEIKVIEKAQEKGRKLEGHGDKKLIKEFQDIFNRAEEVISGSDVILKNSVTSLTKNEEWKGGEWIGGDGTEYGTKFHDEMQRIDFTNPQSNDPKILKAVKAMKVLTQGMKVYREVPFLQKFQQDGTEILVQGIIDLLAVGEGNVILVDYKTTKGSAERLRGLYKGQLAMYADAVKQAMNKDRVECYIYSTSLDTKVIIE
ncbi:MAG: UvrD-helicase domain-containing protein [Firmicutes bacterium]|nr:UvrD-helicase domain-containing protein [Bacillota bacterium]